MKWRKIWSLRHWAHVFRKVPGLLASPRVPARDKLLMVVPAALYWVLPDVLPFIPIDDMAVTMLLMNWFVERAEKKDASFRP
ncbi:hypothetical protein DCC85_07760 [Paenibacillus sp. CAA11]|uniref:hypothetical protein n=1 Tax=Paenibacillus sp. CAA11 TaxID=1532905 RepID=UPI000D332FFF|nr:hypothetical protein [Paenibacillus sp. CAA11]AWB44124.1 hypothetical protein DCC85_07760 [Paenibacillus sp. CAA11]